jgi:hypothetical protein
MALSTELSKGLQPVPEYSDYLDQVVFAPPPPPGAMFEEVRPPFQPRSAHPVDGSYPPAPFPMHVDDYLCICNRRGGGMRFLMHCSIDGLVRIMGDNEPELREQINPTAPRFFATKSVICSVRLVTSQTHAPCG